jgi:hypothetical protein
VNGLSPIIRRKRRPLVIESKPVAPAPVKPEGEKPVSPPAKTSKTESSENPADN